MASEDYGKSWDEVRTSGKDGITLHQSSLKAIPESDQIVSSWSEPNEIGGRDILLHLFSRNDVWRYSDKYCICRNETAGDMGDPTSILLDEGRILTVYYDAQKGIVACTKTETMKVRMRK